MKANTIKTALGRLALMAALALASNAGAIPLAIGDKHELGSIVPGVPAGDGKVPGYIDQLVGMDVGKSITIAGNIYIRSLNTFSPLDSADLLTPNNQLGNSTHINLANLGITGAEYLSAKYDADNAGTEVWYIGGLGATFEVPAYWGQYGLSSVDVFTARSSVPDSGTTAALLGFALLGVGSLRSKLSRK